MNTYAVVALGAISSATMTRHTTLIISCACIFVALVSVLLPHTPFGGVCPAAACMCRHFDCAATLSIACPAENLKQSVAVYSHAGGDIDACEHLSIVVYYECMSDCTVGVFVELFLTSVDSFTMIISNHLLVHTVSGHC